MISINNPEKYSVALYERLSKEDSKKGGDKFGDDSESIKNQDAILQNFVREHRLHVYDTYVDDGFTGTNFQRPGFERMLADIEKGNINTIITKDMSRLGRDYIDFGYYMERYFPEHNIRYIAVVDNFDTETDGYTSDFAPFKALFNDMYAKDISKKITSVKRNQQKMGKFIGGKAPFGYKKSLTERNKIVIDEPAAQIVRQIFQMALDGKSCRQIAVDLNDSEVPTPAKYAKLNVPRKGAYHGLWSAESVGFMLKNEVYIGNMVQGRFQKVSYKSKKCRLMPKEEWTVVENTHEPIIDDETFQKVSELIQSRKYTRSRSYDFLLKGLIFCHECGYPLAVSNRHLAHNRDVLYFVCRTYQRFTKNSACTCHSARADVITDTVLKHVQKVCRHYIKQLDLTNLTKQANQKLQEEKRKRGKDVASIKKELELVQRKIDEAYEDKLNGIINTETYLRVYEKLKKERSSLEQKLSTFKGNESQFQYNTEMVKEAVNNFLNAEEYSRALLISLIERIELTENKELLIYFKFKELDILNH